MGFGGEGEFRYLSNHITAGPNGGRGAIGDTLKARSEANQQVESRIGCAILNRMIQQGKPQSERIEKSN